MRSRLPRSLWAVLLPAFAILGTAVYVFGRTQVAPCLGDGVFGGPNTCYEHWLATRGIVLDLLDTPIPGIALFVVLVVVTARLTRDRTAGKSRTVERDAG